MQSILTVHRRRAQSSCRIRRRLSNEQSFFLFFPARYHGRFHRQARTTLKPLRVHFLPDAITAEDLAGSTAVVIDVLRATTTIVEALAAGATAVIPCATIEEARGRGAALPQGRSILGGERGGLPIEGFDLGNSPAEYTRQVVEGKTVVLTTTNGTLALLRCTQAAEVVVAALANLSAVASLLAGREQVDLVCAGTDDRLTREDVLVAGAIAERLSADGAWQLDDDAVEAAQLWRAVALDAHGDALTAHLVAAMRASLGGQNLIAIGMDRDILLAAQIDRHAIVPRFEPASGCIRCEVVR
jgi:2-phosphosulfolactate phosphatase